MSTPSSAAQRRRFVVAVPVVAALGIVFAVLLQPALFPEETRQAASGAGLLLGGVVTAVSCQLRAVQTAGRRRRSWQLLVVAALLAVAANVWVTVTGSDPLHSPSAVGDAFIAAALMVSIAAVLTFPSVRRRGVDLLVMSLDGLIMGAAVLIIASVLVYSELLDTSSDAVDTQFTVLLFPVLDVVLATVALLLVVRSRGTDRPALGLVASGFIMYAIADLAFAVLVAQETFEFGTPLDLGWIYGYLLIALAAWYPSTEVDSPPADAQGVSEARDTMIVFSVLLVAAFVQVGFGTPEQLQGAQVVLWTVLIAAAGARQTLLTRDNTALRRGLERRVREQTADLRRLGRQNEVLLSSVGDGIYGVDHEGRVSFVNPSGAKILGYQPDQLLGLNAHDEFHAPTPEGAPYPWEGCYVTDAIRDGVVTNAEADVYVRPDGETFPVEITASPLMDEDVVRGAVVVFRDVTQRREVDRMKNEFLSVVSHELRTPLTSIRGSLGLLAGGTLGDLTPRAQSMASIALESTERLTRLINDILDLERIETGSRPMELAAIDAAELLRASAKEMAGFASDSAIGVEVGDAPGRVLADRDRIVQTLTNLIGNAIKFSAPGETVRLGTMEHDSRSCSPWPTTAAGSPRTSSRPSSNGSSRSTPPTPANRAAPVSAWPSAGASSNATAAGSGPRARSGSVPPSCSRCPGRAAATATPMTTPRTPHCCWSATTTCPLSSCSPRCCAATDTARSASPTGPTPSPGPSATSPRAVLLDLRMPGTTGAEALAELKANELTRHIPVIVVSGLSPETEPTVGTDAADWLIKPVSEERLVQTVSSTLAHREQHGVVLLVEDDEDLAGVISTLLAGHGLEVAHATTAQEAVRLGSEVSPDVIVLDLHLPDSDGSTVVAEFRRTRALSQTPLVVYSAADVEEARRDELQLGETVFLTKGRSGPEAVELRVLQLVNVITRRPVGDDLD